MLIPNLDSKNRAHNTRLQQLPKFTSHILVNSGRLFKSIMVILVIYKVTLAYKIQFKNCK